MNSRDGKWTLIFDTAKCNGCCNCVIATMDEYVDNEHSGYSRPMPRHGHKWLDIECHERGRYPMVDVAYLLKTCQHCEDPPCAKPVPGAVRKRDDGIVVIDPVKAAGRPEIVQACPYGAIHWNEELQLPQQWLMDAHLLDSGWRQTRASQACPTGALTLRRMGDVELAAARSAENLSELRPELDSKPRVFYKNLHRVRSVFLAGTVVEPTGESADVVPGATVTLHSPAGELTASTRTDAFGDFKFDGLQPAAEGAWQVRIETAGGGNRRLEVKADRSQHLGDITVADHG
jgi:Fe-S-cluster-containing dehydrogenase component